MRERGAPESIRFVIFSNLFESLIHFHSILLDNYILHRPRLLLKVSSFSRIYNNLGLFFFSLMLELYVQNFPILLVTYNQCTIFIWETFSFYQCWLWNLSHISDDDFHNTIDTWTADGYSNHKLTSNKFNQSTSFNALQKSKSIPLLYLNSTQANSTGSEQSNISGNVSKTWEDLTVAISPYTKERVYVVTPKSN